MIDYTIPKELPQAYRDVIDDFVREQQTRIAMIDTCNPAINPNARPLIDNIIFNLKSAFADTDAQLPVKMGHIRAQDSAKDNDPTTYVLFSHSVDPNHPRPIDHSTFWARVQPSMDGGVSFSWMTQSLKWDDSFENRGNDGSPAKPVPLMDPQGLKNALHTWIRCVGGMYAPIAPTASKIERKLEAA